MPSLLEDYSPENTIVPFEMKGDISDEGAFKGFGTIFDGRPDTSFMRDIIMPGAFHKTIRKGGRNGNGVVMLSQHGRDDLTPIGIWPHIAETSKGLEIEGELATNSSKHAIDGRGTQLASEIHVVMKMKALRGLSIGFDFPRKKNGRIKEGVIESGENDTRIIKEVILWEISPVTFPAKLNANITTVKSIFESTTERELENSLHESGLSKKESMYIVRLCKQSLRESKKMPEAMSDILEQLKQFNTDIKGGLES